MRTIGRMREKRMRGRRFWPALWLALFLVLLLTLNGCKTILPMVSGEETDEFYTRPQIMIVAATERNRYQQVYTDQIWNVVMDDGNTFEAYLLNQVRSFLENLKIMNLLARNQGISLTSAEKDRLRSLTDVYYNGLSDKDIAYMGIAREDVETMYQEYYLANKVVGELTKGVDLEVSDSEAKVITVRMIQISSPEAAEAVYRRISQENADFLSVARETSEGEQIELSLGRGELPEAAEEAAFSLEAGELSPVTSGGDGWFYIFQCVSDYDAEATQMRKTRIYEERKNQVFQQIYSQFQAENEFQFSDEIWKDIHFSGGEEAMAVNFFSLYEEEFGSQGY